MRVKEQIKSTLGKTLSVDLIEKLTEYSLLEQEQGVSLARSERIAVPGSSWEEIANGGRKEVWRRMLARVGSDDLLLLEFGVFKGESIQEFTRLNISQRSRFVGFDSFEGLPEMWRDTAPERFSTLGQVPQIRDDRVRYVKGWFREALPSVADELVQLSQDRALLVHFDADLYSSTLYLLFQLDLHFGSYHFVFDEYGGHEVRALHNYMQATGATCEFYNHVIWEGLPTSVSGRITTPRPSGAPKLFDGAGSAISALA